MSLTHMESVMYQNTWALGEYEGGGDRACLEDQELEDPESYGKIL